jgi:hypothetical protein
VPEDLEAELLAELRLEALRLGVFERDLALVVRDVVDDGHELEEVDLAGLLVEVRLELAVRSEDALGGLEDRFLDRLHETSAVDPLLLRDHVDRLEQARVGRGRLIGELGRLGGLLLRTGFGAGHHDFLFFFLP